MLQHWRKRSKASGVSGFSKLMAKKIIIIKEQEVKQPTASVFAAVIKLVVFL